MDAAMSSDDRSALKQIPPRTSADDYLDTPPKADPGPPQRLRKDGKPYKPRCLPGLGPPRKSRSVKVKVQTLSCENLDGRTHARRYFLSVARGISSDLGGEDRLSTVQKSLVEAFAGIAVHVHNINAHVLRGDKVDICAHSLAISTMVRVASRIGLHRVARDIKSLHDIMNEEVGEVEESGEDSS
jgi:hypothetical protein